MGRACIRPPWVQRLSGPRTSFMGRLGRGYVREAFAVVSDGFDNA